jgi:hypothetical protein
MHVTSLILTVSKLLPACLPATNSLYGCIGACMHICICMSYDCMHVCTHASIMIHACMAPFATLSSLKSRVRFGAIAIARATHHQGGCSKEDVMCSKEGVVCSKEGVVCRKEGVVCSKEGVVCSKEGVVCSKEAVYYLVARATHRHRLIPSFLQPPLHTYCTPPLAPLSRSNCWSAAGSLHRAPPWNSLASGSSSPPIRQLPPAIP